MAFLPYVHPDDITDPLVKEDIEFRIARGKGGQEPISLRANHPWFVRWWQEGKRKFSEEGLLEPELRELVRVRVALGWEKVMGLPDCHY